MIPRIIGKFFSGWGSCSENYSRSFDQSPGGSLSSALIHIFATFSWRPRTTRAAARPTPARIFAKVSPPVSSSASSTAERVGFWVAAAEVGVRGLVGGLRATVAFGRATVGAPPGSGALAVFRAMVGAPTGALLVASLIVGAPAVGGVPPAVRRGMVGAGAGAFGAVGAPEGAGIVAVGGLGVVGVGGADGAEVGVGGLTGATGPERAA